MPSVTPTDIHAAGTEAVLSSGCGSREDFYSLQGEARTVGYPTVFIRLTGCPLRCGYCDTEYAFTAGNGWHAIDILGRYAWLQAPVCDGTGGEPLAQKPCRDLLAKLCAAGYEVSLEISAARSISAVLIRA